MPSRQASPAVAPRERQRRRTRKAIVDAAAQLIAQGQTPSMANIAQAADVSRRTVYLYFPTLEQLLLDATLGLLTEHSVDAALDSVEDDADAEVRIDRVLRAIGELNAETLPLGRSLIRLTVESPPAAAETTPEAPRRGYRRIAWIERALLPLRDRLDPPAFERLVSALAVIVGWEAFIVLSDVRGLPAPEQVELTTWAARTLVRAALTESTTPKQPAASRPE
jgi:AcrR family transcriptional regulator